MAKKSVQQQLGQLQTQPLAIVLNDFLLYIVKIIDNDIDNHTYL